MRKLALLLPAVLLWLVTTPAVLAQGEGIIEGQVTNGTAGAPAESVAGLDVTLYEVADGTAELVATTTSDGDGWFRFEGLATEPDRSYRFQLEYEGIVYGAVSGFPADDTLLHVAATVYEITASDSNIAVDRHHVVVDFAAGGALFQELYIFNNTGDKIYVGEGGTTLRFSLPDGAADVTFSDAETVAHFVETDGGLASVRPVMPGQGEVTYSYDLPYDGTALTVSRRVLYPTSSMDLLVANTGVQAESRQMVYQGLSGGAESAYQHFSAEDLPGDAVVELRLSGSLQGAGVPALPRPSWSRGLQEVGPAIALVMGLLGALLAFALMRRRRSSEPAAEGDVDATSQRGELLHLIADLDDAFVEGHLDEESYHQLRAKMKKRVRDVWAE
jgi:5-hydroxyisourate hydrolase-like protein (transthyretin family)